MATMITVTDIGLEPGTTRTVYIKWESSYTHVSEYKIHAWYRAPDGYGYLGADTTVSSGEKAYQYTAPDEALWVTIQICAVPETYEVNNTEYPYFTENEWTADKKWYFVDNRAADIKSAPTVELDGNAITAYYDNLSVTERADQATSLYMDYCCVRFECIIDDSRRYGDLQTARVSTGHAAVAFNVDPGHRYKVCAQGCYERVFTDGRSPRYIDESTNWSEYSDNVETIPTAPASVNEPKAVTETSVQLTWSKSATAKTYDIEYATDSSSFDVTDQTSIKSNIDGLSWTFTGLETGNVYYFRVRAVNDAGNSDWTKIVSVNLGVTPSIPTTWSSTTTCMVGETLTLNWIHNSADNSTQRYAWLKVTVNGETNDITIDSSKEADDKKTTSYSIDTSIYKDGTELQWQVRTAGTGDNFSDWSIVRTVDIYAVPVLSVAVTDKDGNTLDRAGTLKSFPFYVKAGVSAANQKPISYHLSIRSDAVYELTDSAGVFKTVNCGDEVYSKYFDITEDLSAKISAGDIRLFPGVAYLVYVTVAMDSGLTANGGHALTLMFDAGMTKHYPGASIAIKSRGVTASIQPHCYDSTGELAENVELGIYRREFDGSLTEIAVGVKNTSYTYVTDPHPALDSARYRIVATDTTTGWVDYSDLPPYPVQEKAVIIQWAEEWQTMATTQSALSEERDWTGSILRLPYNIDVSDSYSPDVSLIEYSGRKHPVSYYGNQIGHVSTWNMEIERTDIETLYALRRLANYMGDVYVREPSGSGYWAHATVSFSQTHCTMTIPVTLGIKRVEGGI